MIRSIRKILIGVLLMCTTFIILCKTELSPHEKPVDVVSKGVYGVVDDKPIAKLTQLQKEEYYKQYAEIIDVVTNGSLYGVELAPIGDFKPEDWVTPSKFERIARERANTRIVFENPLANETDSNASAMKSANINYNGTIITFTVSETFNNQSNVQTFSTTASKGSWLQTGIDNSLIDDGQTNKVISSGKFNFNGIISSHHIPVSFTTHTPFN